MATGKAGRTDYRAWDKVTNDLLSSTEKDEQEEIAREKAALGLDGKYANSQAEAEERDKAKQVAKTKKTLESYQKRERKVIQNLSNLLEEHASTERRTVRVTRAKMEAGKRVLHISDTKGTSPETDSIVVTQDLSLLESKLEQGKINGLIKVYVENVHNCTLRIKSKIITGTLELARCNNIKVKIESEATVATIQADLCENILVELVDAPSGKPGLLWGQDKDDRIFHAGVKDLSVKVWRDDICEADCQADYLRDGAVAVGNAKPEEMQFVTSMVDGKLVTEKVVRAGGTTGKNARAMTERELTEEQQKRETAAKMAVQKAEKLSGETKAEDDDVIVEEVFTDGAKKNEDSTIVEECEENKARGNEAFGAGEYAQAVLLYSLALDKADELADSKLFPRHICLSNRSACFLKLGQHEKALEDAKKAHELDATYVKGIFRHGLSLHAMGRYQEALPVLAEALKLEPKNKQIQQAIQFAEVRMTQEMRKRMNN